jgi:hypothetical protein
MTIVKIIGRSVIFLLAAALVIGGVNALSSAGILTASAGSERDGGFAPDHAIQTGATTSLPKFNRAGGDHESEGFSLMGLTTVAKNLMQISIIIAVVALLTRVAKLWSKRRSTDANAV